MIKTAGDKKTLDETSDKNKDILKSLGELLDEEGSEDTDINDETKEDPEDQDTLKDTSKKNIDVLESHSELFEEVDSENTDVE